MATHNTENYLAGLYPESANAAGVLLCNSAKFVASSDTIAVADVINFMALPKGAIIVNCMVHADDTTSSATIDIGLTTKSTGVAVAANGLFKVLPIGTGPVIGDWYGGVRGADVNLADATYVGALARTNYKTLAEVIVTGTVAGAVIANGHSVTVTVLYFMDYGQDFSTTQS